MVEERIVPEAQPMIQQRRALELAFGIAVLGGLVAAVATLGASQRVGSPSMLRVLMTLWNVWPFAGLALTTVLSARWSVRARRGFFTLTDVVTVLSALAYVYFAFVAVRPPTAAFVLMPPAVCLAAGIGAAASLLVTRR